MKRFKTKLTALLMAVGCFVACFGVGVATVMQSTQASGIEAQASATTRTITKAGQANGTTASVLYLYALEGGGCPEGVGNWDDKYYFVADSGKGIKFNGEDFAYVMKQPGDIYLELGGKTAKAGDEVTIDGEFYNSTGDTSIIFENCGLRYNGSAWDSFTPPATFNITEIAPAGGCTASVVNAYPTDEETKPTVNSWDYAFTFQAGTGKGILLGDEQLTNYEIKQPGDFYIVLNKDAQAGDILTLDGVFYSEAANAEIVFKNSMLKYNGSAWETYAPPTTFNITEIAPAGGCTASVVNAYPTDEQTKPTVNSWDYAFTFQAGTGKGILLGDEQLTNYEIKQPGDFYIVLNKDAQAGDILTLDGVFYNKDINTEIVFKNSMLEYDGNAWSTAYPNTNISNLKPVTPSTGAGATNEQVYLKINGSEDLPVTTWDYAFTLKSGDGLKVDGVQKTIYEIKSAPEGLWLKFDAVPANAKVTLSGVFVCPNLGVQYTIEECKIMHDGSSWGMYYVTYNVGKVVIGNGSTASGVYLNKANGTAFEVADNTWASKLTFLEGSGVGATLNGAALTDIAIPENIYVGVGAATEGDMLAIGGTFYNESLSVKYVIEESKFQWNGSAWVEYVAQQKDNLGKLQVTWPSDTPNATPAPAPNELYLAQESGEPLPYPDGSWSTIFTFVSGTGIGFQRNGVTATLTVMKSTDLGLYLAFDAVEAGDTVSIGGNFFCEAKNATYVIAESKFTWNGQIWEPYVAEDEYAEESFGQVMAVDAKDDPSILYLAIADGGNFVESEDWNSVYYYRADSGELLWNGEPFLPKVVKFPHDLYMELGKEAQLGDVITICGTFYNASLKKAFYISLSAFEWNGEMWMTSQPDDELAYYDEVSLSNLGLGVSHEINGVYDGSGLSYVKSEQNVTNSLKFRFDYTSSNVGAGGIDIRLRGSAWEGIRFRIIWGNIYTLYNDAETLVVGLNNNQKYQIEFGAIDLGDDENVWIYIRVDGKLVVSDRVGKDKSAGLGGSCSVGDCNTTAVSIYAEANTVATLGDPDHVAVTYNTALGTIIEYPRKNESYTLLGAKSQKTFVGWVSNNRLYAANTVYGKVNANCEFTAVEIDFNMEDGAAIRLADDLNGSGLRFKTYVNEAQLNALMSYGVKSVSYGTLILPYDYLSEGQVPNLDDFTAGSNILKIEGTFKDYEGDNIIYYGAIKNLKATESADNYGRLFAGRGYMEITFYDGTVITVYTPFDLEDNVRSMRQVAQAYQDDADAEVNYNDLSAVKKSVVDTYALRNEIKLMDYDSYANNFLNLTAWYYPELDAGNAYNNAHNIEIAQDLKAAGIKTIYLDGEYHLDLSTAENVEKTRQIIEFFWSQGLYTIAFGSNSSTELHLDYTTREFPDFSACEGFLGFLVWDEPQTGNFTTLVDFAENFEKTYAGTGVTYMANLLPSYAGIFNGTSSWFDSTLDTLKVDDYTEYLRKYCDEVLSQVSGQKWLSMDSYPINADKSLTANFLFDLAMLKYYAEQAGAHSHAALQSSGWVEDGNETKNRMPTEDEMLMQAYAAMAFGVDSISWWSYSDKRDDNQQNPTDSDEYYTRFANVNNELAAIGKVYGAFEWKGIILGKCKDNGNFFKPDDAYESIDIVSGKIGSYELTASDTKHLSSVSNGGVDLNYLMGVMQDANGNEGYVLCNYNSHESDRTQTITLTFASNVTQVVIYRDGVAQTVTVSDKTLDISLATGEGVIVLPSKLN